VIWLSIPIAVCAWTLLVGGRRRNLITRLGRLLHIACLLTQIGGYHTRHAIRNAGHLAGDIACWLLLMLVIACGALGTALMDAARWWAYGESPEVDAALRRHPSYPLDADLRAWDAEYHATYPDQTAQPGRRP
jgi:hypothetical protein